MGSIVYFYLRHIHTPFIANGYNTVSYRRNHIQYMFFSAGFHVRDKQQKLYKAQFRWSAPISWCSLDLTPHKTIPATHLWACPSRWHGANPALCSYMDPAPWRGRTHLTWMRDLGPRRAGATSTRFSSSSPWHLLFGIEMKATKLSGW